SLTWTLVGSSHSLLKLKPLCPCVSFSLSLAFPSCLQRQEWVHFKHIVLFASPQLALHPYTPCHSLKQLSLPIPFPPLPLICCLSFVKPEDPPSMPLCCTFHCPPIEPPQDEYVPYHSARLEVFGAVLRDARLGGVYTSMVEGCLAPFLSHPSWTSGDRSFIRCDVNFELPQQQRNLNRLLGRAAHIEFLEFPAFIQFFFATHMHLLANGAE
ncbi:unnamed protein product, partial [Closterium sp. NIES-54]